TLRNQTAIDQYLNRKGRFIVATNRLNRDELSSEKLFEAYKDQQGVERGFRFFKDPWFMVDSFFVKKRSRIEALMMVMTLCLLVYNYGQYQLRKALGEKKETLPNQLSKPVTNPTFKWVFQLMEGIAIVKLLDPLTQSVRALITNLSSLRVKIIRLLGQAVCKMYGIQMEIAGM
ncbi:MAG: IS1634 family transposase, partial [Alphaproteobacteria bacterium]|nr:IS1634 family transposase [Alphaproteobacteria bacterium]